MPLDPNIFFRGAEMQMQSRAQMAQQLENAMNRAQQQRQFEMQQKNKGFDLGAAAERAAYEYAMTGNVSPEGLGAIKAYDALNAGKTSYVPNPDGSGTLIPVPRPSLQDTLFGGKIGPTDAAGYQPAFPPVADMGGNMPVVPSPAPVTMEGIPPLDIAQLNAPMPSMGANPPQGLTAQQQQALQARGNPFAGEAPPLPQATMPQITAPAGASPKTRQQAQEANVDVQKDIAKTIGTETAKANVAKQAAQPKAEAGLFDLGAKMQNMNSTLDKAINQVGAMSAGFGGGLLGSEEKGFVAGTPPANLRATLQTIKADAAFAELQKMRDNSPTGGALGAISEKELGLLENAAAALSQSQSPQQLRENLQAYKRIRNESLVRVRDAFAQQYGYEPDMTNYGVPPMGAKQVGTSGGKAVYQLPDGSYVKEK